MTPIPAVKGAAGLNCPNCGAALTLRGFSHTLSIICPQCLSVLDAKHPTLQILQKVQGVERRVVLKIPLGKRGKWRGIEYEIVGFQQRTITVDGMHYSWAEYLLFNPYHGFRYLTEYNNHWNDVRTLRSRPFVDNSARPVTWLRGVHYKHFQTANAVTTFVLGEFPWRARLGDNAKVADFIAPPLMLSAEITPSETVWSTGEYTRGEEVWKAFQLPGRAPSPIGIFSNQPNPRRPGLQNMWLLFGILFFVAVTAYLGTSMFARNEEVFRQRYLFAPNRPGEASYVTRPFELKGGPSNVEVEVRTDLSNNWAYFGMALINDETGDAYDFGREVSYYFGRDSDGSWTEGSSGDTAYLPSIPAGRYYLRVEPEMAPGAQSMNYELRITRDVPRVTFFALAALFLLIPPVWSTIRVYSFEHARWQESDYA